MILISTVLKNIKIFFKKSLATLLVVDFYDISKKICLFFKRCFLFGVKQYLKFNIILIYIFSEYSVFYLFYLFLVMYGSYGGRETGFETSHYTGFFITSYLLGTSIEIFLICKIASTRKFLDNLLGKEYIISYLEKHAFTLPVVKFVLPIIATGVTEIATTSFAFDKAIKAITSVKDNYDRAEPGPPSDWDSKTKEKYRSDMAEVRKAHKTELVTTVADSDTTKAIVKGVSSAASNVVKYIFGKNK